MIDLRQIESFYPENLRPFKRNLLREYLQYKILDVIFSSKFTTRLCFMGGTAIHIIHSNMRFSEDLDFDNFNMPKAEFKELVKTIDRKLKLEGYIIEASTSFDGAYRAQIKVGDILYENGLSGHKGEKLAIHIDIEPQGFKYAPDKVIINKFDVFSRISVVPIDILLAQKIYAIFMRKRPMGRDFYDAIFLFGKTKPNFDYLQAKMKIGNIAELKKELLKRCINLDFKNLTKDVENFLFVPSDAKRILLFIEFIRVL